MRWIKTQEGKLINLNLVTGVEYGSGNTSVWVVGTSVYSCAFAGTVAECQAYMRGLEHELAAVGHEQVLGNGRIVAEALS